jgi:hypothetical protein
MDHRSIAMAVTFALTIVANQATASTASITVTQNQIGVTPQYIGYNMGHYLPGSNTSAWVDYSGVNGFRVWLSPDNYEPTDDIAPFGDGVTDLASFNARKTALRVNPLDPSAQYVNFQKFAAQFNDHVQDGRNKVVADKILTDLKSRGVVPIIELSRSTSWTMSTWAGKWEQWQHYYAMAYYMGRFYDVSRYQTYNEPDLSSMPISEWVDRLKISSDAIRSAVADVNRDFDKNLVADIAAPVAAGATSTIDTWGKTALASNRTDYQGNAVIYDIFDTYDVHRYNSSGAAFVSDMQTLKTKIPQYNASGEMMPVIYTEFNRRNSSSFAGSTDTLDTPSMFVGLADDYLGAISEGVSGMYAFKFSQTLWDHDENTATPEVTQKTGFHYVNSDYETGGKNDVTGATRGAGVVRLAAKAFQGARPRFNNSVSASNSNFAMATSYDAAADNYYVFSTNKNSTETYDLTINLASWNVQPGTVISVEEVSAQHHGEVALVVTVPQNKIVTLSQPRQSVWLLTAPQGKPRQEVVLTASDDARVRNSDSASSEVYADKNYGTLTSAFVGRTPDSARFDYATYVKFGVGDHEASEVSRAIFQITGKTADINGGAPGSILFHVYALTNDSWSENTITWNNAPNLADLDSAVTGVATSAFPVGQLTFDNTQNEWGIDLTTFLRQHPQVFDDGTLTLALVREQRFANDVDPNFSWVDLKTKESGIAPKLRLSIDDRLPGDFDANGAVDARDYIAWRNALGQTGVGLAADGNRDSAVNHTDFNIWRANFGAVAGNPVGTGAFVPEPSTALLTTLATSGFWIAAPAARARIVLCAIRLAMRRNLYTLCEKRLLLLRQREA